MSTQSYDYHHRAGVRPISWSLFHAICKALTMAVAAYRPEIILPVARGGLYSGALIAHMLQAEVYPIRLSRRIRDQVVHAQPQWLIEPPALVAGRRVLIVDEICSRGETLHMAKKKVRELGAATVRGAVAYAHGGGTAVPDYIGLITDDLILNPWDREIVVDGALCFHPEYAEALRVQGAAPSTQWLIDTPEVTLAKGAP